MIADVLKNVQKENKRNSEQMVYIANKTKPKTYGLKNGGWWYQVPKISLTS